AEDRAGLDQQQRLERPVHVILDGKVLGIERVQRIAAVHRDVEMAIVPVERDRLSHSGRIAVGPRELLSGRVGAELPNAGVLFELRTRIDPLCSLLAIGLRTRVRRQPDVDVDITRAVEGNVLVAMSALVSAARKIADDDLRWSRRLELTGRQLEALDRR